MYFAITRLSTLYLQNCLNYLRYRFNKMLGTFLRDSSESPYWYFRITQLLEFCQLHIHNVNHSFHYSPKALDWTEIWWLWRPLESRPFFFFYCCSSSLSPTSTIIVPSVLNAYSLSKNATVTCFLAVNLFLAINLNQTNQSHGRWLPRADEIMPKTRYRQECVFQMRDLEIITDAWFRWPSLRVSGPGVPPLHRPQSGIQCTFHVFFLQNK